MQKLINDLKNEINTMAEYMTITEDRDDLAKDITSPIEKVMYLSLTEYHLTDLLHDPMRNYNMVIVPQEEVKLEGKYYKPDFRITIFQVIKINGVDMVRDFTCYIECDGHDYQERTKEQAQKDRAKDRAFISAGLDLLRFTGSEIYNDHTRCSNEILNFMHKKMNNKEFKEK